MNKIATLIALIPIFIIIFLYIFRKKLSHFLPPRKDIAKITSDIESYNFRRYVTLERLIYIFFFIVYLFIMMYLILRKYSGDTAGAILIITLFLIIPIAGYSANFCMRLMYRILSGRSDHHLLEYASQVLNPNNLAAAFDIIKFDRVYAMVSAILLIILFINLIA